MDLLMAKHLFFCFFEERKGVKYKKICQGFRSVFINSQEREVVKKTFKDRKPLLITVEESNILW